jgi:flagellar export protein FliJ
MGQFTFRLEQVRLYRKQLEEQAMQALSQAVAQRDATRVRIRTLEQALAEQRIALSRACSLSSGECWLARQYESSLKQDIADALGLLREQENSVDACRVDLTEKAKARNLLDTLKEKQAARHERLELQKEQQNNDEIATLRHNPVAV